MHRLNKQRNNKIQKVVKKLFTAVFSKNLSVLAGFKSASILLFFITVSTSLSQNTVKQYEEKLQSGNAALDSIKAELEKGRKKLSNLEREEGSFSERLALSETNIATASSYIAALDHKIDTINRSIVILNDSLLKANNAQEIRKTGMKKRLRMMYKTGPVSILQIVTSASGVNDILNRMTYFQALKKYDQTLLESIQKARERITEKTNSLIKKQEHLTQLWQTKNTEQKQFTADRDHHREMLLKVRTEKTAWEQTIRELETSQKELAALLKTLRKKRSKAKAAEKKTTPATGPFEKRKGSLPWPVQGTVSREFGKIVHPVYQTVTMNTGIDITAPKNANVQSVASGRVDYAGWTRGYGNFVIINHPGGYITIYAHLAEISVKVEQEIPAGTRIGRAENIGDTNNARLHFQIRRDADPLDPKLWLMAR